MPESTQQKYNFNLAEFDHWAQMAVVDPDAFEARRSRLIEAFISSVPPERQPRLRGLHGVSIRSAAALARRWPPASVSVA